MISFPRAAVRAFHAVARRGVVGRHRGPAPPLALIPGEGMVTFAVQLPAVVLHYRVPTDQPGEGPLILPMEALDAVEGTGADLITLEAKSSRRAILRWTDRGQPRSKEVELLRKPVPESPQEPTSFAAMPQAFLDALHEAGRSAGRANDRYTLDRIQLKGSTGEVAATDGQQAYLHGGFHFSFPEDVLVPGLPLFGAAELCGEGEIELGRTESHVVLRCGPWTLFLPIDGSGRFPDVASAVPKANAGTLLRMDDADAAELRAALPKLPGAKEERRPVTLYLVAGQAPIVRAQGQANNEAVEVVLNRSTTVRGSTRVAIDRTFLDRALHLGCRTFQVAEGKPCVARGSRLVLLAAPLDPELIVLPTSRALVPLALPDPEPVALVETDELPMAALAIPEVHQALETIDPMAEAEALRIAFVDAGQRVGRLMAWFKVRRKEPQALAKVWATLQSLRPLLRGGRP